MAFDGCTRRAVLGLRSEGSSVGFKILETRAMGNAKGFVVQPFGIFLHAVFGFVLLLPTLEYLDV